MSRAPGITTDLLEEALVVAQRELAVDLTHQLESDADRERFKVKKRFQMRDGERFFADGRERANYELLQQQMRLPGNWRLNLRRTMLLPRSGPS
mgnify:CR=1 FL=1